MKLQYSILADLKRIDDKLGRLKADIDKIPRDIEKLEFILSERKKSFDLAKSETDLFEKQVRSLESDLKDKEDALKKAESKMMEVKTNTEYQAAVKENEGQKAKKGELEERALAQLMIFEERKATLKKKQDEYQQFESKFQSDRTSLMTDQSKLDGLFNELVEKKKLYTDQLNLEVKAIYRKADLKSLFSAVAITENNTCTGCNIRILPQVFNEVLGFKTIHKCQNCGKILIHPPAIEPQSDLLISDKD